MKEEKNAYELPIETETRYKLRDKTSRIWDEFEVLADVIVEDTAKKPVEEKSESQSADKDSSKGKADKDYKLVEINQLTGSLILIPNSKTIKINSGETITIMGLGKYLSGQYFVDSITRRIDNSSGYSHEITVLKTGFAGSLKSDVVPQEDNRPVSMENVKTHLTEPVKEIINENPLDEKEEENRRHKIKPVLKSWSRSTDREKK